MKCYQYIKCGLQAWSPENKGRMRAITGGGKYGGKQEYLNNMYWYVLIQSTICRSKDISKIQFLWWVPYKPYIYIYMAIFKPIYPWSIHRMIYSHPPFVPKLELQCFVLIKLLSLPCSLDLANPSVNNTHLSISTMLTSLWFYTASLCDHSIIKSNSIYPPNTHMVNAPFSPSSFLHDFLRKYPFSSFIYM